MPAAPDPLELFARHRCTAILRTPYPEAVGPAIEAAIEGGFRIVELTLNTPGALEHVAALAGRDDLLVGAGTVLDVESARAAREAGARFLVAPDTNPEVVAYAREHGLLAVPGAGTPTEMLAAHRAGAALVKLFPAPAGGPETVRTLLGPLPFLRLVPTSGVTLENAADYLRAGAFAVGFVASLFRDEDLREGRFERVRDRARAMTAAVRGA